MKRMIIEIIYVLMASLFFACSNTETVSKPDLQPNETIDTQIFEQDVSSLIRNPCMGWGLYDDANDEVQNAEYYWSLQDNAAREDASFFYVRWRWSDMEPEEGKYAWVYNDNYKRLIHGALDRGLKLSFRVYINSKDNLRQSTPDFVRHAGAEGYIIDDKWTPYPDDPVFQQKLAKFVEAFAKEYDNPSVVDFVDGYNIGWWGEAHNIKLQDPNKLEEVFDWYTTMYSSNFKNILLTLPYASQVGFDIENRIAINGKGYAVRRDGLGSRWFIDGNKQIAKSLYGKVLLIGEAAYWGGGDQPWVADPLNFTSWRDVYELTFQHAIDYHFNTLDLREVVETERWRSIASDLVKEFKIKGGYRIYLTKVTLPINIEENKQVKITHSWKNTGTGYLPNNLPNWNYKYKPAFALLNNIGEAVKVYIDFEAEPSTWINQKEFEYHLNVDLGQIPSGKYKWAVAIVDVSKTNSPGIKLSMKNPTVLNGWYILKDVII